MEKENNKSIIKKNCNMIKEEKKKQLENECEKTLAIVHGWSFPP